MSTASTRRAALGFSAAIIAGLTKPVLANGVAPTSTPIAISDPVSVLYRRYQELQDAFDIADERYEALRAGLVERWGEPSSSRPACDHWGHDPDYPEFRRTGAESDRLSMAIGDLAIEMTKTPATTLAGIRAKAQVALEAWPTGEDLGDEYHEVLALAFMKDALRMLDAVRV